MFGEDKAPLSIECVYDLKDYSFDRAPSLRRFDVDGKLHVTSSPISKANICGYYGYEIPGGRELGLDQTKMYYMLRDPEELKRAEGTFNNLPLLSEHEAMDVNNFKPELVIGSTGTDARFDGVYLNNSLVFWTRDAITKIKTEERVQLSSCYRYRADMTPGTYGGKRYDGVMRDIIGNHVALVREGRAGPDVAVGDAMPSKKVETLMRKQTAYSTAVAKGAIIAMLRPVLAADAKVDYTSLFAGVTGENIQTQAPVIVSRIVEDTKDKLAKDAKLDIDGLTAALDAALKTGETKDMDEEDRKAEDEDDDDDDDDDDKGKKKGAVKRVLKEVSSGENGKRTLVASKDGDMPENGLKEKDKPAKDGVTKAAMDAAIVAATEQATKNALAGARAIREAEKAVRPYVGELAIACDSADEVYRHTLKTLGVKVDGVHASAYPALLALVPVPGTKREVTVSAQQVASDAAASSSFAKRYPDAARITSFN